jgi:hypothetical protein
MDHLKRSRYFIAMNEISASRVTEQVMRLIPLWEWQNEQQFTLPFLL